MGSMGWLVEGTASWCWLADPEFASSHQPVLLLLPGDVSHHHVDNIDLNIISVAIHCQSCHPVQLVDGYEPRHSKIQDHNQNMVMTITQTQTMIKTRIMTNIFHVSLINFQYRYFAKLPYR